MEVPTKWSRASVISFIKGLGKRAGVRGRVCVFTCVHVAPHKCSGFPQTGPCVCDLLFVRQGSSPVLDWVFTSNLSSESVRVGSQGQERSVNSDTRRVVDTDTISQVWGMDRCVFVVYLYLFEKNWVVWVFFFPHSHRHSLTWELTSTTIVIYWAAPLEQLRVKEHC